MQIRPDSLFAKYTQQLADRNAVGNGASAKSESDSSKFLDLVSSGVGKVNEMQINANDQVQKMLAGEDVHAAEVMTGLQKADMAFRLLVQVRNKLMQAYQEINNIRI